MVDEYSLDVEKDNIDVDLICRLIHGEPIKSDEAK